MDSTADTRIFSHFHALSKRIRSLSKSDCKLSERHSQILIRVTRIVRSRVVIGLFLCAGGLIAGALAHESAKQEALEAWHSEHFPSMATWTATLGNQGFIPLKEAVRLHQALRTLPLTMDAVHTVWISEDLNWVTVFEEEPFVFTRTTGALPSHWSPSGVAWVGFDQAQQELSKKKTVKTVQLAKSAPGIRKPGPKIALDPRALRF